MQVSDEVSLVRARMPQGTGLSQPLYRALVCHSPCTGHQSVKAPVTGFIESSCVVKLSSWCEAGCREAQPSDSGKLLCSTNPTLTHCLHPKWHHIPYIVHCLSPKPLWALIKSIALCREQGVLWDTVTVLCKELPITLPLMVFLDTHEKVPPCKICVRDGTFSLYSALPLTRGDGLPFGSPDLIV